jgi:quercetin dioxygenase-like cupin family protein
MPKNVVVADVASVSPCQVIAERISILADHNQTGSYEIFVHDAPKGAGPPPHVHPWDEAFYVLEGEVEFSCGNVQKKLAAGGFVHVPAGTVHAFRYATSTSRILGVTSGPGAAATFAAIDRECGVAPDIEKVMAVLGANLVRVVHNPD